MMNTTTTRRALLRRCAGLAAAAAVPAGAAGAGLLNRDTPGTERPDPREKALAVRRELGLPTDLPPMEAAMALMDSTPRRFKVQFRAYGGASVRGKDRTFLTVRHGQPEAEQASVIVALVAQSLFLDREDAEALPATDPKAWMDRTQEDAEWGSAFAVAFLGLKEDRARALAFRYRRGDGRRRGPAGAGVWGPAGNLRG